MSVSISNLFNFSKTLPEPFNTLASKKVKVSSKYGSGTESTLCATVIKAIHAVCNCMMGTGEGAVGSIDHRTVAEYKSAAGTDIYHLVVFDSSSGNIMASVYDKNTETIENYQCHSSALDGAAVMMALVPLLLKDDEFDENFQTYFDQRVAGYPDMKKTTEAMAILCDNAYRRIKDDSCPEHIKVTLDKSGNVLRVSQSHLLAGAYTPNSVLAGEFTIFAQTGKVTVSASRSAIDHKDFVSQYKLTGGRILTALEEALVPKLEEWYIIPEEVVDICKHALSTTGKPMQMRNFLLRGPAGTGKTYLAVAAAVAAFRERTVNRIILTRPAVEAGERLGFLPGDLQNKVDPYLRPLYDALYDMLGAETFQKYQERGSIEVAPLAYMRGRTLDDSFIILDEAQNTTKEQMKMFLTRLGFGSKIVITGDVTQIDLPDDKVSGLKDAIRVLDDVKDIAICRLTSADVVRHALVQQIINAYEKAAQKEPFKKPAKFEGRFKRKN